MQYKLGLQDPAFSETRYHTVIFIETESDGGGYTHEVTGDIASSNGMTYQTKKEQGPPEQSETFHQKYFLGWVHKYDYPSAVDQLLRSLPSPPRQRRFDPERMMWVQCKPDDTPYGPKETPPPYEKCTEWTEKKAIPCLQQRGVLHASLG